MTASSALAPIPYVSNIRSSGLTIYDPIEIGDPKLWIPSPDLERLLDGGLRALSLAGLPIRSRSKVAKEHVCRVLGYPIPGSFRKSQPRFPGQIFDTYVQKSNNLQIWNEELSPTRRYVLIRLSSDDVVTRVKVVAGDTLAEMDTTGTVSYTHLDVYKRQEQPVERRRQDDEGHPVEEGDRPEDVYKRQPMTRCPRRWPRFASMPNPTPHGWRSPTTGRTPSTAASRPGSGSPRCGISTRHTRW